MKWMDENEVARMIMECKLEGGWPKLSWMNGWGPKQTWNEKMVDGH